MKLVRMWESIPETTFKRVEEYLKLTASEESREVCQGDKKKGKNEYVQLSMF